ncbi:hypothetical protein KRR39_09455 [Nocardioides panacis]|uniref:Uncharacterized protein n=1 Tax=Nocardioides panacis TaxID=2849501 RepID=A0A975T366_9ACTN|nr:hypothetical protein [Nocardioides panacis]QWZ10780.1 hypothetical protein KRR39_09455 [Nocardioides panacis]
MGMQGGDGRQRAAGRPARQALLEQPDAVVETGQRHQERAPSVGELTRQSYGLGSERGQVDRDRGLRDDGQLQGTGGPLDGRFEALAGQQSAYLPRDRAEPLDGRSERHVVQALRQWWAAGSEPEHEPVTGDLGEAGGQHRDAGRCASPDVDDAGAEGDPVRPARDLGQQHPRVVTPALGQEERVVPQLLRPVRDVQHDLAPRFEGRQSDRQPSGGHAVSFAGDEGAQASRPSNA